MTRINVTVDGVGYEDEVEPRTLLVHYLRESLGKTGTVVCVLTHDPKFDVPLLEVALRLPEVADIGAMGSRRTHDDRFARLREAGLTDEELDRLSSPNGLDLGARTPEETAVSIAPEIVALQWGGRGDRLSERAGAIHHHALAHPDATGGGPGQTREGEPAAYQS